MLHCLATLFIVGLTALSCFGQSASPLRFGDPSTLSDELPFFGGADYDATVPTPEQVLHQRHGTRLAHYAEIVRCFQLWGQASSRLSLSVHSTSHEGRELLKVIITSPANHARLDEIRAGLAQLVDPGDLDQVAAEALLQELPAVAWMGYSIHGDELSGADASLALAYHLVADRSADTEKLLEQLVVVMDPVMNPDGRERIIGQIEQLSGRVTNFDVEAMQRGRWPFGRGNHYLFDLNRDWMTGVQPETRGRWAAARDLPPQLFVDAHEMGALDTFLFYPQSDPHNPNLPATLDHWQRVFAADQGAAFDQRGWSYYTREWADAWAPFYSDAWGSLSGAVGMLYEQAGIGGAPIRNQAGQLVTYRDTVRHQAVSSLANLHTLAEHRQQILADFLASQRAAIDPATPGNGRMLAVRTGSHPFRERELLSLLLDQEIRVYRLGETLSVTDATDLSGQHHDQLDLPPGSWLVPAAQPFGAAVKSYLAFDVRLDREFLLKEREDLERGEGSNIYDATAWSLPLLFDLDACWCDAPLDVAGQRLEVLPEEHGQLLRIPGAATAGARPVAWVVDGSDDRCLAFAVAAMEDGLVVVAADEAFDADSQHFSRGSLLVRRADNDGDLALRVGRAAEVGGVSAVAVFGGRAPADGADLGGGHFAFLSRPRVAMLSNAPVRADTFGHLWNLLDRQFGVPLSFLDAQSLGGVDLRRYNVLILPPGGLGGVLSRLGGELAGWVRSGGTLVAVDSAAVAVATMKDGFSSVTLRRKVLDDLEAYQVSARREAAAREVQLDMADLWGADTAMATASAAPSTGEEAGLEEGQSSGGDDPASAAATAVNAATASTEGQPGSAAATGASQTPAQVIDPDAARQDTWERRFSPAGVILRGLVDDRSWLTSSCAEELPVLVSGSHVLLAGPGASTVVRLAGEQRLRLSGLLWPEARKRLADSSWLTVESLGAGQIILFSGVPGFRGQFLSAARLFGNAVVLGPGLGASPPGEW